MANNAVPTNRMENSLMKADLETRVAKAHAELDDLTHLEIILRRFDRYPDSPIKAKAVDMRVEIYNRRFAP